ncbi:hypothetical protein [Aeribacillus composti]
MMNQIKKEFEELKKGITKIKIYIDMQKQINEEISRIIKQMEGEQQ